MKNWLIKIVNNFNRIKGNDIFISYSRADSLNYSLAITNILTTINYYCFLDQYHNKLGTSVPKEVIHELNNSSAMIVILSPKAIFSESMIQEVIEFKKTNRLIIPIKIDNVSELGTYSQELSGLAFSIEPVEYWQNNKPSEKVINRIIGSFKYRKRLQVLKNVAVAIIGVIIIGIICGVIYSKLLTDDIFKLKTNIDLLVKESIQLESLNENLQSQNSSLEKNLSKQEAKSIELKALTEKQIDQIKLGMERLERLNDSTESLYASNLIGFVKNEEVKYNVLGSRLFDPFNVNRRMLLAVESYKRNFNEDAKIILREGVLSLGKVVDTKIFDAKTVDIACTTDPINLYMAVLLENGKLLISEKGNTATLQPSITVPHATNIYFIKPDELLFVVRTHDKDVIHFFNHLEGKSDSFHIPMKCKMVGIDANGERLFFLDREGTLLCYRRNDKELLFEISNVFSFAVNKTRRSLIDRFGVSDKITIWKKDEYMYTYTLDDKLTDELASKHIDEWQIYNSMIYSLNDNFAINSFNKIYIDKPNNRSGLSEKEKSISYYYGTANIGFGPSNNHLYFSSMKRGPNAIHFLHIPIDAVDTKEVFRILYNGEINKIVYDPTKCVLYGMVDGGRIVGWDICPIIDENGRQIINKLEGEALIDAVCERLLNNFTQGEWDFYFNKIPYCRTCLNIE